MLIDGRTVTHGTELTPDLCVIGAGAAGITLARELSGGSLQVLLLESGGLEPDRETQSLAAGEVTGIGYVPLESARIRAFGGATGHWAGWCRPFDALDFETRPWVPHSGWPITLATLDPWYRRAQPLCELGAFDYQPADWELGDAKPLPLKGEDVETHLIQFSPPTRFGQRYRGDILASRNVRLCTYANVVRLDPDGSGRRIERVQVATLAGTRFTVKAPTFVLATGGIDNPRLLLASNHVTPKGIGNDRDLVGRYFADHIQLDTAGLFPLREDLRWDLYLGEDRTTKRHPVRAGGTAAAVMGYLTLADKTQRRDRTLNYSCKVLRTWLSDYYLHAKSQQITDASAAARMADKLRTIMSSVSDAASIAADRARGKLHTFYKLVTTQEQAPNPESRVTLGGARDRFDVPVARLDWRLTDLDRQTIATAFKHLVQAFSAGGIARVQSPLDLTSPEWPSNIGCSWHHCGTTRMSADPREGVVDANCKVHGVENLYVAGSSVFTTNGHGNPTLTLVALALRLADHLRDAVKG